jgi:hypothetical protein
MLSESTIADIKDIDNSKLEVEMTFSDQIDLESVKSNFMIYSENDGTSKIRGLVPSFFIDENYGKFTINSDSTIVKFISDKPLYTISTGIPLRYKLTFYNSFKDTSGKDALSESQNSNFGYINLNNSIKRDFLVFSMANDDTALKLESVTASDNLNDEDRISLNFNKSLDVYVKRSIPEFDSKGNKINIPNIGFTFIEKEGKAEIWYQTENTDEARVRLGIITLYRNGVNIPFDSYTLKNYEFLNGGKTLSLKLDKNTFIKSDRVYVEIDKLKSPAGKDISTDNSGDSSGLPDNWPKTNDSKKLGAVN